jgi:hypothetical protein
MSTKRDNEIFTWVGSSLRDDKANVYYSALTITKKNVGNNKSRTYKVGDHVYFRSDTATKPYIAEIENFYEAKSSREKYVTARWFYRASDVLGLSSDILNEIKYDPKNEVFYSAYTDINLVWSIHRPCTVVIVPAGETLSSLRSNFPPVGGDVYICRYEFGLKTDGKPFLARIKKAKKPVVSSSSDLFSDSSSASCSEDSAGVKTRAALAQVVPLMPLVKGPGSKGFVDGLTSRRKFIGANSKKGALGTEDSGKSDESPAEVEVAARPVSSPKKRSSDISAGNVDGQNTPGQVTGSVSGPNHADVASIKRGKSAKVVKSMPVADVVIPCGNIPSEAESADQSEYENSGSSNSFSGSDANFMQLDGGDIVDVLIFNDDSDVVSSMCCEPHVQPTVSDADDVTDSGTMEPVADSTAAAVSDVCNTDLNMMEPLPTMLLSDLSAPEDVAVGEKGGVLSDGVSENSDSHQERGSDANVDNGIVASAPLLGSKRKRDEKAKKRQAAKKCKNTSVSVVDDAGAPQAVAAEAAVGVFETNYPGDSGKSLYFDVVAGLIVAQVCRWLQQNRLLLMWKWV